MNPNVAALAADGPRALDSRAEMLARVRANQPAAVPLPDLPAFGRGAGAAQAFRENLARMGGTTLDAPADADLEALIEERFPDAGPVCSATPEVRGDRAIDPDTDPRSLEDVGVGVVRARFGVAETGSVWLSETELRVNALGFLSQHLVVLLDPARIVANLHDAYQDEGWASARYAALMTGPSATADIEGVLIHGAQGIRSLTVVLRPDPGKPGPAVVPPQIGRSLDSSQSRRQPAGA
jgi:L-lactate dehydrogenase complex protein LldG